MKDKLRMTGSAIFALAFAMVGCWRADLDTKFASARSNFASKPSRISLVEYPFLKGKVVMIGSTDGGETAYQRIPELADLEAGTPDEVGTVILKECRSTQKGVYRTAENPPREIPAIAMDCVISLIDRGSDVIYFSRMFEGKPNNEAPLSKVSTSVAMAPEVEIKKFLTELPRS